jgi:hypothetical protein
MVIGFVTYLLTDLSPGLMGLGRAFLALFCDPASPGTSGPDLERSSSPAILYGVYAAGRIDASGDLASSSSSMSMVSTSALAVAMSIDIAGATLFLFFFFASAIWVAAIIAADQDADILPAVCRGARAATFGGALPTAGSSSSLPTDESKR